MQMQDFSFFLFIVRWWGGGQGKGGVGRGVGTIFSYTTHCINLIHIAKNVHEDFT